VLRTDRAAAQLHHECGHRTNATSFPRVAGSVRVHARARPAPRRRQIKSSMYGTRGTLIDRHSLLFGGKTVKPEQECGPNHNEVETRVEPRPKGGEHCHLARERPQSEASRLSSARPNGVIFNIVPLLPSPNGSRGTIASSMPAARKTAALRMSCGVRTSIGSGTRSILRRNSLGMRCSLNSSD
jgi:hypothetical protein